MLKRIGIAAAFTAMLLTLAAALGQPGAADPDGEALFLRYCASCHGPLGEGDGPVASTILSVPNLRTLRSRSNGTFPRDRVIRYIDGRDQPDAHGDRLMPVWGDTFSVDADTSGSDSDTARLRIAAIVDYLTELQR